MARFAAVALALLPAVVANGAFVTGSENLRATVAHAAEDVSQSFADRHLGCWKDTKSARAFQVSSKDSNMTPSKCASTCADYPYYGVQYGNECWCGNYASNYEKHGSSTGCTKECAGDGDETCGGYYAMNVYTQSATDEDSIGCFADKSTDRVLGYKWVNSDMKPNRCKTHCSKRGLYYYATQYSYECWCGDSSVDIDKHGSATCDRPCSGDPTTFCGGSYAFTAYLTGEPEPTPTPSPNPSPTPVVAMPEYEAGCSKASVRYAQSTGPSGRVYIQGPGCFTLTDLYEERSDKNGAKGPIYILDDDDNVLTGDVPTTGRWLLTGEMYVEGDAVLYVHGSKAGGDADVLRIQSEADGLMHEIRGYGGKLSFKETLVTSWDTTTNSVQTDYENPRSFINCVSEYLTGETCVGKAVKDKGECRMDIINSEMGYLGYFDSESYGLTWKVRGFCVDKSNEDVFETTNVYGDIIGSDIHHMYYGMYSYGHQGGVWTDNKMHDNHAYGFDPHDDSDYLLIANNEVWGNENHGIIASKRCNNVVIRNNEVYDGGAQAAGIFLHRSSDSAKVYDNYVHDMQDAGIAMLESFNAEIYDNEFKNVKYGIRISLGGSDNDVHDNVFENCEKYGLYTYAGSDAPDVSSNTFPVNNTFRNNKIYSTSTGVKFKEASNTNCYGNTFTGCDQVEFLEASGTSWYDNTINSGACTKSSSSSFSTSSGLPNSC